jgi:hypothetical protein
MFDRNVRRKCSIEMFERSVRKKCSKEVFDRNVRRKCSKEMFEGNVQKKCSKEKFKRNVQKKWKCWINYVTQISFANWIWMFLFSNVLSISDWCIFTSHGLFKTTEGSFDHFLIRTNPWIKWACNVTTTRRKGVILCGVLSCLRFFPLLGQYLYK